MGVGGWLCFCVEMKQSRCVVLAGTGIGAVCWCVGQADCTVIQSGGRHAEIGVGIKSID